MDHVRWGCPGPVDRRRPVCRSGGYARRSRRPYEHNGLGRGQSRGQRAQPRALRVRAVRVDIESARRSLLSIKTCPPFKTVSPEGSARSRVPLSPPVRVSIRTIVCRCCLEKDRDSVDGGEVSGSARSRVLRVRAVRVDIEQLEPVKSIKHSVVMETGIGLRANRVLRVRAVLDIEQLVAGVVCDQEARAVA